MTRTCVQCGKSEGVPDKGAPFCSSACQQQKRIEAQQRKAEQEREAKLKKDAEEKRKAEEHKAACTEQCLECRTPGSRTPETAYCDRCYLERKKDIMTAIFSSEQGIKQQHCQSQKDVDAILQKILRPCKNPEAVLDLHGVTDTVDVDADLGVPSVVCSFVGKNTDTRVLAADDIELRVRSGQILFGVLVFVRGKRKKNDGITTKTGSKAWFCTCVPTAKVFVDDSEDHVQSVHSLEDGPTAVLFDPNDGIGLPEVITQNMTTASISSSLDAWDGKTAGEGGLKADR